MRCPAHQVDDRRKPSLAELIPDWPTLQAWEEVTRPRTPPEISHPHLSYSNCPFTASTSTDLTFYTHE